MKNLNNIVPTVHSRFWLLALNIFLMIMISSCSSSSDGPPAFTPQNTLDGKVVVFGSQLDANGDIEMYVTGTKSDGSPLSVVELQAATVTVSGTALPYSNSAGGVDGLSIEAVTDGEPILSLGLLTDWSNSTNGELQFVSGILTEMLDSLPPVFEAQVMTFSDDLEIRLPWTNGATIPGLNAIKAAVTVPHSVRNETALYDSMGGALEADPADLTEADGGLIDRCRPAHMLVVFTDGDDNRSNSYVASDLAQVANLDKTVVIMLGTSDAVPDVLTTLAGDYGAVVQVTNPGGLVVEVQNFAASLNNMVKFTLDDPVDLTGRTVTISLGTESVVVDSKLACP